MRSPVLLVASGNVRIPRHRTNSHGDRADHAAMGDKWFTSKDFDHDGRATYLPTLALIIPGDIPVKGQSLKRPERFDRSGRKATKIPARSERRQQLLFAERKATMISPSVAVDSSPKEFGLSLMAGRAKLDGSCLFDRGSIPQEEG